MFKIYNQNINKIYLVTKDWNFNHVGVIDD